MLIHEYFAVGFEPLICIYILTGYIYRKERPLSINIFAAGGEYRMFVYSGHVGRAYHIIRD